jgi:hypothetical protein
MQIILPDLETVEFQYYGSTFGSVSLKYTQHKPSRYLVNRQIKTERIVKLNQGKNRSKLQIRTA